jgi:hypothetical protein
MPSRTPKSRYRSATPFDSVENTQEYFKLLAETLLELESEIEGELRAAHAAKSVRRVEALHLVSFKLRKLEEHLKACSPLLNDLRSLRRLLLNERVAIEKVKSK